MSKLAYTTFRTPEGSWGQIKVVEEEDGSMWVRTTVNGVVLSYERIDDGGAEE